MPGWVENAVGAVPGVKGVKVDHRVRPAVGPEPHVGRGAGGAGYVVRRLAVEKGASMSENDLVLRIPHALGAAEAQRRLAGGVASAKTQYPAILGAAETEWKENRLTFALSALAQTVRGTVDVESDYVELRAQLPTVIRLLAKRFVPLVQDAGAKLLNKPS